MRSPKKKKKASSAQEATIKRLRRQLREERLVHNAELAAARQAPRNGVTVICDPPFDPPDGWRLIAPSMAEVQAFPLMGKPSTAVTLLTGDSYTVNAGSITDPTRLPAGPMVIRIIPAGWRERVTACGGCGRQAPAHTPGCPWAVAGPL